MHMATPNAATAPTALVAPQRSNPAPDYDTYTEEASSPGMDSLVSTALFVGSAASVGVVFLAEKPITRVIAATAGADGRLDRSGRRFALVPVGDVGGVPHPE